MSDRGSFRGIGRGRSRVSTVIAVVDGGGGVAITSGLKLWFEVPYACTIEAVRIEADQVGSITFNIYKLLESERMAGVAADSTHSICAQSQPLISSAQRMADTTLSGWDTYVQAGDWLYVNVDSASTVSKVSLSLTTRRYFS